MNRVCTKCKNTRTEDDYYWRIDRGVISRRRACKYCEQKRRAGRYSKKRSNVGIRKVHWCIEYAVKTGHILKPNYCDHCGKYLQKQFIQAHHHNGYNNIYDFKWLCHKCHSAEHKQRNARLPLSLPPRRGPVIAAMPGELGQFRTMQIADLPPAPPLTERSADDRILYFQNARRMALQMVWPQHHRPLYRCV